MKKKLGKYQIFPSVLLAGKKSKVTIVPRKEQYSFEENEYVLFLSPTERKDKSDDPMFHVWTVPVEDGALSFEYDFQHEQEYGVFVETKEGKKVLQGSVYALEADLYETLPYKGDLHFHSVRSDGRGELPEIAGALREKGYDFLCLTDHYRFYPSEEMKAMYEGVDTGLHIFLGEEVQVIDIVDMHIVNFNGGYSVNSLIEKDYDNLKKTLVEEAKHIETPDGVDAVDYVFRKWICDEIRKSGGLAIFPHPYWSPSSWRKVYHTGTATSIYAIKQGVYDAFELLNGSGKMQKNNLQVALYQELRAEGVDIPIVGSTDSHGTDCETSTFDHAYTLVFAKDVDEIPQAILDKRCVAVENIPNEMPRVHGHFRMVKYALFLIRHFYPEYMALTKPLGGLVCAYGETKKCAEDIEIIGNRIKQFRKRYFNAGGKD